MHGLTVDDAKDLLGQSTVAFHREQCRPVHDDYTATVAEADQDLVSFASWYEALTEA